MFITSKPSVPFKLKRLQAVNAEDFTNGRIKKPFIFTMMHLVFNTSDKVHFDFVNLSLQKTQLMQFSFVNQLQ